MDQLCILNTTCKKPYSVLSKVEPFLFSEVRTGGGGWGISKSPYRHPLQEDHLFYQPALRQRRIKTETVVCSDIKWHDSL